MEKVGDTPHFLSVYFFLFQQIDARIMLIQIQIVPNQLFKGVLSIFIKVIIHCSQLLNIVKHYPLLFNYYHLRIHYRI